MARAALGGSALSSRAGHVRACAADTETLMSFRISHRTWGVRLLVLFALFAPRLASAQACPAGKYCFYVPPGLPLQSSHSTAASRVFDLVLSAPVRTITGTYTVPGSPPESFSVSPGKSFRVALSGTTGYASAYDLAEERGVFLVADGPDLTVDHRETFSSEQYSETLKRDSFALGTRFRLAGYSLNGAGGGNMAGMDAVLVYAPTGATVTLSAPPGSTLPFWQNSATASYTFTLAAGQTYAVRTLLTRDIDGGLLTSDQPVAVSTGGRGWSSNGCGDDGMDGLVPVSALGTEYVVRLPTGSYTGSNESRVRVIADVDGTEVRVNGALVATLSAGAFHSFQPTALSYVQTSQPTLVWMNGSLNGCELDTVLIPPIAFAPALRDLSLDFNVLASNQNPAAELAVLIAAVDVGSIRLNGAAPTLSANMMVPGRADLAYVRFNVGAGDQNVTARSDFQAMLGTRTQPSGLLAYYNPYRIPGCGDAGVDAGEACDDGNVTPGDGCSSSCQIEIGYACTGTPSVCSATCGDRQIALPVESCDDGNPEPGDGCGASCRIEARITAPAEGARVGTTPTLMGTADPGATVVIMVGGERGMVTADASGAFTFTPAAALSEGMHVVMLSATDVRGGTSTAARTLIVDTTTTLTVDAPAADAVTGARPLFHGTGEPGARVALTLDGAVLGTVAIAADGRWELPVALPLPAGPRSLVVSATDEGGNTVSLPPVRFVVDDTTSVSITAPSAAALLETPTPTIRGMAEPLATVALTTVDARGTIGRATTTASADGSFSVLLTTPLEPGEVTLTALATDAFDNMAMASVRFGVRAPLPPVPLAIGEPAVGATLVTATPTLRGTAPAGARVSLIVDEQPAGEVVAAQDGSWSWTPSTPLAEGPHVVRAATGDGATAMTDQRAFAIDTETEVELTPDLMGIIPVATPTLAGRGEPGAVVVVELDGMPIGTATVDAQGTFSVPLAMPLDDGQHTVTVRATDRAGNLAEGSRSFAVDTQKPLLEIRNPVDGASTNDATPPFSGIAEPNAQVSVVLDQVPLGTIVASAAGSWAIDVALPLPEGAHTIYVAITDAAGHVAEDRHAFTIEPAAPALALTGPKVGMVLAEVSPVITGTAKPGLRVLVTVDDQPAGEVTADAQGVFGVSLTRVLADGHHRVRIVASEGERTVMFESGFTIDTATTVRIVSPVENSATAAQPTVVGRGDPNAMITLWLDDVELATVDVAIDGQWLLTLAAPLTPGPHVLRARALDPLGNTAEDVRAFRYDEARLDADQDGRDDARECGAGLCPDTDGDGLIDSLDPDDDGDSLPTALECPELRCPDTDGDGLIDPLDADDDGDGRRTVDELSPEGRARDTDSDGSPDHLDRDDDGDGLPTRDECTSDPCPDTDGDGAPDFLDPDDDGDTVPTARERADAAGLGGEDLDMDGLPSWLDDDANGNDVDDSSEGIADSDGDGVPDYADLTLPAQAPPDLDTPKEELILAGGSGCSTSGRAGDGSTLALALFALYALARRRRAQLRQMETPPSTSSAVPVVNDDASDAR